MAHVCCFNCNVRYSNSKRIAKFDVFYVILMSDVKENERKIISHISRSSSPLCKKYRKIINQIKIDFLNENYIYFT